MILCKGCRYYASTYDGLCKIDDGKVKEQYTNQYDGRVLRFYGLRPSITEMRREGGRCGPDAILRKPDLWEKIKKWDW